MLTHSYDTIYATQTLAYSHVLADAENRMYALVLSINRLVSLQHIRKKPSWFLKGHSQIACFIKTDPNQNESHHIRVTWISKYLTMFAYLTTYKLTISTIKFISEIHSIISHNCQAPLLCYYSCIDARHECKPSGQVFWNSSFPRDKTKPIYRMHATITVKTMT